MELFESLAEADLAADFEFDVGDGDDQWQLGDNIAQLVADLVIQPPSRTSIQHQDDPLDPPPPYVADSDAIAPVAPPAASLGYDAEQSKHLGPIHTLTVIETLRQALKARRCDERALITILTSPEYANPWAMQRLVDDYGKTYGHDLPKDVENATSGPFRDGLLALLRGPLGHDVYTLRKALGGIGTDEAALADVLLGRSNADVRAIAEAYRQASKGAELGAHIARKVGAKTVLDKLYRQVLLCQRPEAGSTMTTAKVKTTIAQLRRATDGATVGGVDAVLVGRVLATSSDDQIRLLAAVYQSRFGNGGLLGAVKRSFRSHVRESMLHMINVAVARPRADAFWLQNTLFRTGVGERHLIYRFTAIHWDRKRLADVKRAYAQRFNGEIGETIAVKTSGRFKDLVLALAEA